jgi:hypothetical protein
MSDEETGSVTWMIRSLRRGDRAHVPALWERYFERLAAVAGSIVRSGPLSAHGTEEDAALSAIDAFCNGIADGRFPYVDSREVLWGTLAKITERKAMQRVRGRRWEVPWDGDASLVVVEPTPEYRALVNLVLEELIDGLEKPVWRQAVLLVLEGHTVPEIAARLGRSREAIYVWFRAIRAVWEERLDGRSLLD